MEERREEKVRGKKNIRHEGKDEEQIILPCSGQLWLHE
jgi:hypothetical protein